jgi:hypothetical protein
MFGLVLLTHFDLSREWTRTYARADNDQELISPEVITPFVDMGFPREKVVSVLKNLGITQFSSSDRATQENRIMEALLR